MFTSKHLICDVLQFDWHIIFHACRTSCSLVISLPCSMFNHMGWVWLLILATHPSIYPHIHPFVHTNAPSSANLNDMSRPMPLPAPVTKTTSFRTSFFCTGKNTLTTPTSVYHNNLNRATKNSVRKAPTLLTVTEGILTKKNTQNYNNNN